jgi:predicted RecB family nuclease
VPYDFTALYGARDPRTLWQDYEKCISEARAITADSNRTRAAYSSACKLCYWYSACIERLKATDDLTLIPELGRSKRDVMLSHVVSVGELAARNLDAFLAGKKTVFPGIGPDTLAKFHMRAKLLTTKDAAPIMRGPLQLPGYERELFFDIEVDPMRDICYLHGFIERTGGDNASEKFTAFFADKCTPDSEKAAFADAWNYMQNKRPCAIYYYSKYERTVYRKLQQKYPDVCSADEVEELFSPTHAIDLYNDVVKKATEWPTWDLSIKTLAKYLGFAWRDTHPSGAASIEWFDRWVNTGDPVVRQRILDYNEDDRRATRVLLDGIRNLN